MPTEENPLDSNTGRNPSDAPPLVRPSDLKGCLEDSLSASSGFVCRPVEPQSERGADPARSLAPGVESTTPPLLVRQTAPVPPVASPASPPAMSRPARVRQLSESDLAEVENRIGYVFKDKTSLAAALVHSSARENGLASNERMEFLGDSVIGLVVSELLYQRLPNAQEGELSSIKSVVVSSSSLGATCKALGIPPFIVLGKGISKRKPLPVSVLANVLEAIAAAVYLDGGMAGVSAFLSRALRPTIEKVIADEYEKNYKSLLQQYTQRELNCIPRYRVLREFGPDHEKEFEAMVELMGKEYGPGRGKTKKEAEQQAARITLAALNVLPDCKVLPEA